MKDDVVGANEIDVLLGVVLIVAMSAGPAVGTGGNEFVGLGEAIVAVVGHGGDIGLVYQGGGSRVNGADGGLIGWPQVVPIVVVIAQGLGSAVPCAGAEGVVFEEVGVEHGGGGSEEGEIVQADAGNPDFDGFVAGPRVVSSLDEGGDGIGVFPGAVHVHVEQVAGKGFVFIRGAPVLNHFEHDVGKIADEDGALKRRAFVVAADQVVAQVRGAAGGKPVSQDGIAGGLEVGGKLREAGGGGIVEGVFDHEANSIGG